MAYEEIEDYGLIGDMHTAALVGKNGSIDWLPWPRFDSAAVFASILDEEKGGYFQISPVAEVLRNKQMYWPDTNILITRFLCPSSVVEVTDYMPVSSGDQNEAHNQRLIRRVEMVRGNREVEMKCHPAFDFGRASHSVDILDSGACFRGPELSLGLSSPVPLERRRGGAVASFPLKEGETVTFLLEEVGGETRCRPPVSEARSEELFEQTVAYWQGWLDQCTYTGRWREMVYRSALTLKLLTFRPSGAIVAAPTTSLPEEIGGERNWDYRYTWIRDAAFTLYALLRIGFTEEAAAFMDWLRERTHELASDGSLQVMYGIDGRHELEEKTLDHFEGYKGSRPVRVGNAASGQLQLDIYGELMDAIYLYNKYGSQIGFDLWKEIRKMADWVCENWNRPDEGVWEPRGGRQHFVYSKLMCWVALDRALRLARKRSFPAPQDRWRDERDRIYKDIMERGWSEERGAFTQHYATDSLDAANLIMPLVFFVSPTDPRMLSTIDEIMKSPKEGGLLSNGLVHRYNLEEFSDGLAGEEGTFNICTFWLVEALTRAGQDDPDRLDEARLLFEKMLGYANHLGLYSEEISPGGQALGNYPQAFTHLSLISAAFNLDRALGRSRAS